MLISERLAHKRPVFSFEFFPPKTDEAQATLLRHLEQLAPLQPDFVSVTYGAGGSTRSRTIDLVTRIKRDFGIEAAAHLTCVGSSRDELAAIIDHLGEQGVQNIMALRGDPPKGESEFQVAQGGFAYASELVAFIKERGPFCVGAACYPEVHPEAESAADDMKHLKSKVDAGADFLVSQLFFDNRRYFDFLAKTKHAGINIPILAGIWPITNAKQILRIAEMSHASIPEELVARIQAVSEDPQETFWTGVSFAAHQCRRLLHPEYASPFSVSPVAIPGIHFYTMNRSPATRAIFEMLRLSTAAI